MVITSTSAYYKQTTSHYRYTRIVGKDPNALLSANTAHVMPYGPYEGRVLRLQSLHMRLGLPVCAQALNYIVDLFERLTPSYLDFETP